MKRWHNEISIMERQRRIDLREHRRSAMKIHWRNGEIRLPDPEDFECECRNGRGMFRKQKEYACSCRQCRYIDFCEWQEKRAERKKKNQELRVLQKELVTGTTNGPLMLAI